MVRLAEPKDIDAIYEICKEALENSLYSHIPHDEHQARQVFAQLIVSGSAWVTDNADGVLLGFLQPAWFNHSILQANDLIFYVRDSSKSQGVRLVKKYMAWAKENADETYLSISYGKDIGRTEKFYFHLGFVRLGGSYMLSSEELCR